ncbi:MAG: DPP IV N-terminal domain-containing protein [Flavobacteriaceae bacterium]
MKHILLCLLIFSLSLASFAQNTPKPNYRLASKYSPKNLKKVIYSTRVNPHWLKRGNRFWYEYKTSDGTNFYIVNPVKKTKRLLFNNTKMAEWLSKITKDPYDAKHLPKFKFKFVKNETAIQFKVTSTEDIPVKKDTAKAKKSKSKKIKTEKKVYYFEYQIGANYLTERKNVTKKDKKLKWGTVAPDSSIVIFSKHYNLYWMDMKNYKKAIKDEKDSTIVEHQWTKDGEVYYSYGGGNWGKTNEDIEKDKDKRKPIYVNWSPNSKKFVYSRDNTKKLKNLWVIHSVTKKRPTLESFKYTMPGEPDFTKTEILIFDVQTKKHIKAKIDTTQQLYVNIYSAKRKKSSYDDEHNPSLWLAKTNDKIYYSTQSRDRKRVNIGVIDANTGESKILIKERSNTYLETRPLELINNGKEFIHWSERDGWAHFYLYDANGNLKNQITHGAYHSDRIAGIDEKNRVLYFQANAKESNEDPYYYHLYKVNFNGSGLKLLNSGNFTHSANMNDNTKYFVDTYSRVNTAPKSVLRNNLGQKLLNLETSDLSQLFATGYKFPETFKVKAADGITDLYGVLYKPYDFDSTKVYPIIEYVYPGPQTEAVAKAFSTRMNRTDRMAQVGFIVVTVGNRGGNPNRSKWYHNFGYGNLRDYGLADKKVTVEQLANRYSFIDVDKVGIFGHSGGGFMSTAAMLVYPDVFKVAVSSSGNHDNTIYNNWWSETHHGVKEVKDKDGKVTYEYKIDVNQTLAKNLKGHLMLTTGDIDNNVNPGITIRMANALIKANKRFDFFMMPGQRHGYGSMTEYFFWLKADYFSKHLLGVDRPNNVDILEMNRDIPQNGKN